MTVAVKSERVGCYGASGMAWSIMCVLPRSYGMFKVMQFISGMGEDHHEGSCSGHVATGYTDGH